MKIGKILWVAICFLLIICNIVLISKRFKDTSGDMEAIHGSILAFNAGKNPYLLENVHEYYKSPYAYGAPPVHLFFMKGVYFMAPVFGVKLNYYIVWYLAILGTFLIIRKASSSFHPLFLMTLLMTGFVTAYFNFATGNIALIDLFFFAIAFYWLIKSKYYPSAFFAALPGLIKPYNLILGGPFIFAKVPKTAKLKIYSIIAGSVILTQVLSWVFFPDITPTYYQVLFNKLPQHGPLQEGGGICNPASIFLIKAVVDRLLGGNFFIFVILYLGFAAFVARLFFNYMRKEKKYLKIFSMGILALLLVMPRLKPHSFVFALLPIYFLTEDLNLKEKFLMLLIVSISPLVFLLFTPAIDLSRNIILRAVWHYNLFFSLLAFFMLYFIRNYARQAKSTI